MTTPITLHAARQLREACPECGAAACAHVTTWDSETGRQTVRFIFRCGHKSVTRPLKTAGRKQ